jgi:hypothetical protein
MFLLRIIRDAILHPLDTARNAYIVWHFRHEVAKLVLIWYPNQKLKGEDIPDLLKEHYPDKYAELCRLNSRFGFGGNS